MGSQVYINHCGGKSSFCLSNHYGANHELISTIICQLFGLVQILIVGIGVFFPSFFPQTAFFNDVFSLLLSLLLGTDVTIRTRRFAYYINTSLFASLCHSLKRL